MTEVLEKTAAEKEKEKLEREKTAKAAPKASTRAGGRAVGDYTGNPLVDTRVTSGENYKAEKYIGIGPLVVKTARGEIKALSGDIIVYYDDPTDKEKPVYLHVIPFEVAEKLGVIVPDPPPEADAELAGRERADALPAPKTPPSSPNPTARPPVAK